MDVTKTSATFEELRSRLEAGEVYYARNDTAWLARRDGRWLLKYPQETIFLDAGDTFGLHFDDWEMFWTWKKPETMWSGEVLWLPGEPTVQTHEERWFKLIKASRDAGLFGANSNALAERIYGKHNI